MNLRSLFVSATAARSVIAVAALVLPAASAALCTETMCSCIGPPGEFILPTGVEIPADSLGIPYWGPVRYTDQEPILPTASAFRVERFVNGRRVDVGVELSFVRGPHVGEKYSFDDSNGWILLVSPRRNFVPGDQYLFTYSPRADPAVWSSSDPRYDNRTALVIIGSDDLAGAAGRASAALLRAAPPTRDTMRVFANGGLCSVEIDASAVDISIDLPAELSRWSDVLLYTVTVDGKLWRPSRSLCSTVRPGESWVGRGRERVFTSCGRADGRTDAYGKPYVDAGVGTHEVTMTAWFPGLDTTVGASTTIELACDEPTPESTPVEQYASGPD